MSELLSIYTQMRCQHDMVRSVGCSAWSFGKKIKTENNSIVHNQTISVFRNLKPKRQD